MAEDKYGFDISKVEPLDDHQMHMYTRMTLDEYITLLHRRRSDVTIRFKDTHDIATLRKLWLTDPLWTARLSEFIAHLPRRKGKQFPFDN